MKRKIFAFACLYLMVSGHAQFSEVDSLKLLLASTKEDTTRVMVLSRLSFYDQSFERGLLVAEEGLDLAKKIGFKRGEAQCLHQIGNQFQSVSIFNLSLYYYVEALKIWDNINDQNGASRSLSGIGTVYKALQDYPLSLDYFSRAIRTYEKNKDDYLMALGYSNIGNVYLATNRFDTALYYFQRSYEHFNSAPEKYQLISALNGLGHVQRNMGNSELAISFYRLGIANGLAYNDSSHINDSYLGIAKVYQIEGKTDSVITYAMKSLALSRAAKQQDMVIEASRFLSDLYENKDAKKALYYLRVSMDAKDSVFGSQRILKIQELTYTEKERQRKIAENKLKEARSRKHNLQYIGIAIGIITFIILFFALSRSIVVGTRFVEFLTILGLLAVFEFINLFVHPYLATMTNDSLVLMLLILIAIGALLVPLHHRLEKWITRIMVEKNKKIRLAAANKTIEKLGPTSSKSD